MDCVKKCVARLLSVPEESIITIPPDTGRKGYLVEEFFPYIMRKGLFPIVFDPIISSSDYPNHHLVHEAYISLLKNNCACIGTITPLGNYHYLMWDSLVKKCWCPERGYLTIMEGYSMLEIMVVLKELPDLNELSKPQPRLKPDPSKENLWQMIM